MYRLGLFSVFFFFNDTATTEIYTLSLHDALPISERATAVSKPVPPAQSRPLTVWMRDRKSTRLNSSHLVISYAVFCLKKKKTLGPHHVPTSAAPPFPTAGASSASAGTLARTTTSR